MVKLVVWGLGILALLTIVDRVLLRMERKGWINYRRRGLNRSGAAFHALELQSIFSPGAEHLAEVRYQKQVERDDSGDPPGDDEDDELFDESPRQRGAT